MELLNQIEISIVSADTSPKQFIRERITHTAESQDDEPFYVFNVGKVVDQYERWEAALPNVQPFYAVKCNTDPLLLRTLAALGAGFDCASKNEIDAVLSLGASPNRIVYANTYKNPSFLRHAKMKDVDLMTFDSQYELEKVKQHYPLARLLLRLKCNGGKVLSNLGDKFGCTVTEGKELLEKAKELGLHVIGVCFHVGLNCQSPGSYGAALKDAAELFSHASDIGFDCNLLDIGGGFTTTGLFETVAASIKTALNTHFSDYPALRVIAEPGYYFASATHALAVCVIGKRIREQHTYMYYLSHGLFGSFLNYHILNYSPPLTTLKDSSSLLPRYESILWGPTCAPPDKLCVMTLPELQVGDWFVCEDFGAYTHCMASSFNGFPVPPVLYYVPENRRRECLHEFGKVVWGEGGTAGIIAFLRAHELLARTATCSNHAEMQRGSRSIESIRAKRKRYRQVKKHQS